MLNNLCKKFSYKFCIQKLFYNKKNKLRYVKFEACIQKIDMDAILGSACPQKKIKS